MRDQPRLDEIYLSVSKEISNRFNVSYRLSLLRKYYPFLKIPRVFARIIRISRGEKEEEEEDTFFSSGREDFSSFGFEEARTGHERATAEAEWKTITFSFTGQDITAI